MLKLAANNLRRRPRFISIELRQVRLVLDGRPVLQGIDWRIRPGQRWVLMGPNGAGKTQLMKLLAADVWPTGAQPGARRYRYHGETFDEPYGIRSEIAYLGAERQDRYEHYEWNQRVEAIVGTGLYRSDIPLDALTASDRQRIQRLLRRLRIESLLRRRFLTLSYGERRLVLLARALAWAPKLLLLDELFNGLDTRNRERVAHCLRVLSRSALPWVLSTHRAQDIPAVATHLCLLEAGRISAQRVLPASRRRAGRAAAERAEGDAEGIADGARGRSHASAGKRVAAATAAAAGSERSAAALISLRAANVWRGGVCVLRGLSLQIAAGECWVVHGANGSGKSSFMQLLYGDLGVARGGTLVRAGISSGMPIQLFKRRVGLVTNELQALQPRWLRAVEAVASGLHASIGLHAPLSARERARAQRALREVGAAALAQRALRALSYGQLRRVLFARALIHRPDMLLLDEPYAGVDAPTRARLRSRVQRAVESGVTTVIATHHRDEWPQGATHEIEFAHGRVRYCGPLRRRLRARGRLKK
jgi:molybdate transport system ATP-binding protein